MTLKDTVQLVQKVSEKYLIDKPYIVGGLPRDIYMGLEIKTNDLDLTTNSPDVTRLGILVADQLNVTFELADDGHLTVFADEFDLDFSSHFVSESVVKYLQGKYKGLEEAFSRDFTINTLHQDLITDKIVDPTEMGFQDIKNKLIKTPVPAEITLTDDPRRAYRAINLAVRYDFTIDEEIKDFVIKNPDLFGPEKIKDKYITVKINKSLVTNPDLTIKLLRELNLFNKVPLSGDFKNFLIQNKLLAEYLESNPKLMSKQAQLASSWSEYISQGPAYAELKTWWEQNASKMPGHYNSSYQSWNNWYMSHYRDSWNFQHKGPEEVLSIMQQELQSGTNDFNNIFKNHNPNQLLNPGGSIFESNKPVSVGNGKVLVKPGVNIDNVTPAVKDFIIELGEEAARLGVETPVITSGWRSVEEQAKIMAKNWIDNGGKRFGRRYLIKLYGEDYGSQVASIFEKYGPEIGQQKAIDIIKSRPIGSSHILSPGQAVDLRITSGIKKVLNSIVSKKLFDLKIVNESGSASPNYHVTIKGRYSKSASMKSRKQDILKLINY